MFTSVQLFLDTWRQEYGATARVLGALTDASLAQAVAAGHRTLGDIAWHLTTALRELAGKVGLAFDAPNHAAAQPSRAAEIHATYEAAAGALADAVAGAWNDDALQERFEAYGTQWTRGQFLSVILRHEIHHRGQLTVLMRQAGLAVPGVYGPSKDGA